MIITCPHCQTKYQVTFEAIGSAGRKVQCAHCGQAWDQRPLAPAEPEIEDDRLFDQMAEDALDEVMAAEEQAVAAEKAVTRPPAPPSETVVARAPDAAELRKRQAAFSRRQSAVSSRLPLARLRRAARVVGVVVCASLAAGAYFGRAQLVERYPDLAGVYEAMGIGVNVVGLNFAEVATLKTLSNGSEVLMVSAQIVGLQTQPVPVPPVVVSLLDDEGRAIYEWSVVPQVPDLMAGERATFDTRLSQPPGEAVRVRLSFAGDTVQSPVQAGGHGTPSAAAPTEPAHATPEPSAPVEAAHGAPEHH